MLTLLPFTPASPPASCGHLCRHCTGFVTLVALSHPPSLRWVSSLCSSSSCAALIVVCYPPSSFICTLLAYCHAHHCCYRCLHHHCHHPRCRNCRCSQRTTCSCILALTLVGVGHLVVVVGCLIVTALCHILTVLDYGCGTLERNWCWL